MRNPADGAAMSEFCIQNQGTDARTSNWTAAETHCSPLSDRQARVCTEGGELLLQAADAEGQVARGHNEQENAEGEKEQEREGEHDASLSVGPH